MQTQPTERTLPNLRPLLDASGFSQAALADLSGLSPQYISDILSGRRTGWASRHAIAEALGCKIADLYSAEQAS